MKKNFVLGLTSLSCTLSSSGLLSLVLKYLLVMFLLIEQGRTDTEEINKDPIALLHKNLKYWRSIYDTYKDEIELGYCWVDYFLSGTNDIRSDFISTLIENEFMRLNKNVIEENYFSYGNYPEYDVDVNSSDEQNYNEDNITKEKYLQDILKLDIPEIYNSTQLTPTDQVDNLKYQSSNDSSIFISNLKGKRSRRHNEEEIIIEPYDKLGNPYQRYFSFFGAKVFTLLKKKLALVNERSLSAKESNVLRLLQFLFQMFSNSDKIMTHESSYLYDILRNQMSRIDRNDTNDTNDRKEETTLNQTIWSLFDDKYNNKDDKVQVQDLISFRKNLKTRNKRSARRILSTITENSIFIAVYKTLTGIFRVGQLIIEIINSRNVLKCTKDYLLKKIIEYTDSL